MFRLLTVVAVSYKWTAAGTIFGAALLLSASHVGTTVAVSLNSTAPVDASALTGAGFQDQVIRDVGCIGYHGSGSGYARNGKCIANAKD
jgi:hypothetical protein